MIANPGPSWPSSKHSPSTYRFNLTLAENVPLPLLEIMTTPDVEKRAEEYLARKNFVFDSCLGVGTQGSVFVFNIPSQNERPPEQIAVKFHDRAVAYNREVGVFLRLRDLLIEEVCGHMVPILIGYDDELLAIEMTIVSPPFCLDFGGAYLDQPPDYSPEVWADWREMKAEAFEDNWPAVETILNEFKTYGIYIADVNPGNIKF